MGDRGGRAFPRSTVESKCVSSHAATTMPKPLQNVPSLGMPTQPILSGEQEWVPRHEGKRMAMRRRGAIGILIAAIGLGGVAAGKAPATRGPVEPATGRIVYQRVRGSMITEKTVVWSDHG